MQECFLWHFLYLERIHGVLDRVPRGHVGPPGPLELTALPVYRPSTIRSTQAICSMAIRKHAQIIAGGSSSPNMATANQDALPSWG